MPLSHTGWTLLRIGFSLLLSKAACISRWLPNEWDPTAVFCLSHSWMLPAPSKSSDLASRIAVLVKAIWWESFPHKTAPLRSLSYIKNIPVFSSSSPSPLLAQREHFPTLLPQAFMIQTFFILWDHIPLVIISPAISKTFFERLFGILLRSSQFIWGNRHINIYFYFQGLPFCGCFVSSCSCLPSCRKKILHFVYLSYHLISLLPFNKNFSDFQRL